MTVENLLMLVGALAGLVGAGVGLAAILKVRADKRVLFAQAKKIDADSQLVEVDAMAKLAKTLESLLVNIVGPLNKLIDDQASRIQSQEERILYLERVSSEQGSSLVKKNCLIDEQEVKIQAQAEKIRVLEEKVHQLETELADWQSGRRMKIKTGPLALKGEA